MLIATSSCNRYIDKATTERKLQIMEGNFTFYPDSNVLIYKSNVKLTMDTEVYAPKSFYTKLPKGIKWYEMENSQVFRFFYNKEQVVLINIDLRDSLTKVDSSYVPAREEMSKFVAGNASPSNRKFDVNKIELNKSRKQLIIKRDAATILLYNIEPKNYDSFVTFLKEFTFL